MYAEAAAHPKRWTADELARFLNLHWAERNELNIRTIGSVDVTKAERQALRLARKKERDRNRQRQKRASKRGIRFNLSKAQPWKAEAISRATWYRRHRRALETE